MMFPPPLGHPNPQLADALKRLSAAKFGKPRNEVEREIFKRLRAGDEAREAKEERVLRRVLNTTPGIGPASTSGSGATAGYRLVIS